MTLQHIIHAVSGLSLGLAFASAWAIDSSSAWAIDSSSLFDKPLHEEHLPLPPNPAEPGYKPMLSCFYYPHFMVKQVDFGEPQPEAEQLSITDLPKDQKEPSCRRENAEKEKVIDREAWEAFSKALSVVMSNPLMGGQALPSFQAAQGFLWITPWTRALSN